MAHDSYCIYIDNDGSDLYGATVFVAPASLPAGGTRVPIEWYSNPNQNGAASNITNTTDATPIVLKAATTVSGLATGDIAEVYGHLVNTTANGAFKVTVSGTTITLQNSVGAGGGNGGATGTIKKLYRSPSFFQAAYRGLEAAMGYMQTNGK